LWVGSGGCLDRSKRLEGEGRGTSTGSAGRFGSMHRRPCPTRPVPTSCRRIAGPSPWRVRFAAGSPGFAPVGCRRFLPALMPSLVACRVGGRRHLFCRDEILRLPRPDPPTVRRRPWAELPGRAAFGGPVDRNRRRLHGAARSARRATGLRPGTRGLVLLQRGRFPRLDRPTRGACPPGGPMDSSAGPPVSGPGR